MDGDLFNRDAERAEGGCWNAVAYEGEKMGAPSFHIKIVLGREYRWGPK